MALISICCARGVISSDFNPVMMLITPAGKSDVAKISPKVIAERGDISEAIATTVFPLTTAGAILEISPKSGFSSGAITPTTPVGCGEVKFQYGAATGLRSEERRVGKE